MTKADRVRILVADDNEVNQRVIRGMLEHRGYEVGAVHNGEEVLDALRSERFDLVIMDCMMPVMDGYDATRAIRASTSGDFDPGIPVLAITALAAPGDRERCLDSGMSDYIPKPVAAGRLFEKLDELVPRSARPAPVAAAEHAFPDILESLSERLRQDVAAWLSELRQRDGDTLPAELGRLAHKIRGSADVFGAVGLSCAAERLETAVRNDDFASVPRETAMLERELATMLNRLDDSP